MESIIHHRKKVNKKTNSGYEKLKKCVTTAAAEMLAQYNSSVIDPLLNGFINGKSLTAIVAAKYGITEPVCEIYMQNHLKRN